MHSLKLPNKGNSEDLRGNVDENYVTLTGKDASAPVVRDELIFPSLHSQLLVQGASVATKLVDYGKSVVCHRYSDPGAPNGSRELTRLRGLLPNLLPREGCLDSLPLTYIRHLYWKANGKQPALYECVSEANCPFATDSYLQLCCHLNFGHSVLVRLDESEDISTKKLQGDVLASPLEAAKCFYPVLTTSLEPTIWKFACTLCPLQFTYLNHLNDHLFK
ncbi:unnamed protein product [Dibothriocephalus latus]|uniref:Uncharacterized protein n=1 Tax=Dibothriocephalus latus TaxID=60516 RepID=A0A3P7MBD9_DIBLA|nr:unnamed protein product [Dibothriocephalus latus]